MADNDSSRAHLLELPSKIRSTIYGLIYDIDAPRETSHAFDASASAATSPARFITYNVTHEHDKWAAVLAWESEGPELNADYSLQHQQAIGVIRGTSKMLDDFIDFRMRIGFDPTIGKGMTAWNIRYLNPSIRFYHP